jgi:hypothetical protein
MPTIDQLRDRIAADLARKNRRGITLEGIRDALIAAPAGDRDALVQAIAEHSPHRAGELLGHIVQRHLEGLAQTEAAAMVADGSLSLAELDRWLD